MKKLEAQHLVLGYARDIPAIVQGLSLALEPGKFVGVVGPNGSGKSTLVRALSRVLKPHDGAVRLNGRDLYSSVSARESARAIATVPQTTSIAFEFTVREIVEMGRTPHRSQSPFASPTARDRDIVENAMSQAGVTALRDRIASTLSGGEQQRVLLARALAQEPSILLLDEPTSHLDLHHQTAVLKSVRSLTQERGMATLAVLHDLNLAASYCDTLLLMKGGRAIAHGPVADVLTEANVHEAYGARVWVRCHPVSGRPYVLSLPDVPHAAEFSDVTRETTIHVICGAGTGAGLLFRLRQLGYNVSAGALNAGDTDQEAADLLGIEYAREAPFTALSTEATARGSELAQRADVVAITDVPFGNGNIGNLRAGVEAIRAGKRVVALSPEELPFEKRDFTGGEGGRLWKELLEAGMREAPDVEALIDVATSAVGDDSSSY
jgi:iron complex transport system ATP-binding protein